MPKKKRPAFVALIPLVQRLYPGDRDPGELVAQGCVLVDGAPISNVNAFVRADAAIKVVRAKPLKGTVKLAHAIAAFGLDLSGVVAVDVGAAAGGFTQALLDAGAARVYSVDAGVGQLRGWLRTDPRVVNLEHTNLARLGDALIPEPVGVVVVDLSYLSIADAVPQINRLDLAAAAHLIALVKPTFELQSSKMAAEPAQVSAAVTKAGQALESAGWGVAGQVASPVLGSRGAVEVLLLARRLP